MSQAAGSISPVDRVIAVDWSGDRSAAGQRKKIWAAVWTSPLAGSPARQGTRLVSGLTRAELAQWLISIAEQTPRTVVGVDCCFSFPAWFLTEHGCGTVFDFWTAVSDGLGEQWLRRECTEARFWGVPGSSRSGKRPAEFSGLGFRNMMRTTDWENTVAVHQQGGDAARAANIRGITAKSPFQIGGSGSVGTASLRAMPILRRLRDAGFRVWPFETSKLADNPPRPLLLEIYSRLLTGPVVKSDPAARKRYLSSRRRIDPAYAALSRSALQSACTCEDAFDALVSCVEMVRWRCEFAALQASSDPVLSLEGITWRAGVQLGEEWRLPAE